MSIYYFEIEETKTGWLRVEAESLDEARDEVLEGGFDDCIESEEHKEVTILCGGEEEE